MTRSLLLCCLLALPAAAQTPEAASSAARVFPSAGAIKFHAAPRLTLRQIEKAGAAVAGSKYLQLSGWVSLQGSGFASAPQNAVTVTVTGYAQLRDQDGHYLNGSVQLSDTSTYWLTGQSVSGWAHPSAFVGIYDDKGRYLGTINVSGTVFVSGFRNGSWLSLNGSGSVQGAGYVDEPTAAAELP